MVSFTEKRCGVCSKLFFVRQAEVNRGRGLYCSHSCAASIAAKERNQNGDKNPRWIGGVTSNQRKQKYRSKHPERHEAHAKLTKQIRSGAVVRRPCEVCGAQKTEGHHSNYKYNDVVVWLCKKHHLEEHGGRLDNGL